MLTFNPLLPFGFDDTGDVKLYIKDEEGNEIDITEYVSTLKTQIDGKVNIFQGLTNGNKVVVTDQSGNITTVNGVVMNEAERQKLAAMTNVMLLKGIVDSYEALYQVANPQIGWCYYVRTSSSGEDIYEEYVYTDNQRWELLGHFNASQLPMYYGGTATVIDRNYRINLQFDTNIFEVDNQNRLTIKNLPSISGNNLTAGNGIEITPQNAINIKFDPEFLEIDTQGRLTLKYKIRAWVDMDGESGNGSSSGSNGNNTSGYYLKQVSDLDSYEAQQNEIVQYVGSDGKYTNGYVYIYANSQWLQKNVQPTSTSDSEWINIL